ncbi:MAG: calcium:proton antiporter [Planctomycetota bacterium]|nr:calcium:proton antiporter [Planctomycetota bacterium]MDA1106096.1 calcium:proton antiporter [Planctomycetota bacterium]
MTHSVSDMPPGWMGFVRREWPLVALVLFLGASFTAVGHSIIEPAGGVALAVAFTVLLGAILAGVFRVVHHAEAIAHRVGEPLGTLILTLSVIGIEVALVMAMMLQGNADATAARDTMFAVVMLAMNLILGLALVSSGSRFGQSVYNLSGSSTLLGVLVVLGSLSLIFPRLTVSAPGGQPSCLQSWFLIGASIFCYGMFIVMQVGDRKDWFQELVNRGPGEEAPHGAASRTTRPLWPMLTLLLCYLLGIILLAEHLAHGLEGVVESTELPHAIGGVVIAAIILAPEGMVAIQAAKHNQPQRVINLSVGSALSTIGLTVPAVLVVSMFTQHPVELGLEQVEILLLALTFIVSIITLCTGRTTFLHGILHLAILMAYLVLIFDT